MIALCHTLLDRKYILQDWLTLDALEGGWGDMEHFTSSTATHTWGTFHRNPSFSLFSASRVHGATITGGQTGCQIALMLKWLSGSLGEGRVHPEISHELLDTSWTNVDRAYIAPWTHIQKAILPSVENRRMVILLFPNKEILEQVSV